jgi:DNA-binding Lrp family transcriptional regulator
MSYIKLDRKMLEWKWLDVPEMVSLWIYILLRANYGASEWHDEMFEEGTFPTSISKLSEATGLSTKQVRTCLERLKKTGEIVVDSNNRFTKITVCKWSEYQGNGKQEGKPKATKRQTEGNQRATLKEDIKEDIKEEQEVYIGESCSPEFAEALEAYEEMRKKIRKPLTERAKQMVLKKLENMAPDEETQIAILNQSTMNSWQGVFPLDEQKKTQKGMVNVLDL